MCIFFSIAMDFPLHGSNIFSVNVQQTSVRANLSSEAYAATKMSCQKLGTYVNFNERTCPANCSRKLSDQSESRNMSLLV